MIKGGNRLRKEGLSLLTVEAHICPSSPSECQEVRVRHLIKLDSCPDPAALTTEPTAQNQSTHVQTSFRLLLGNCRHLPPRVVLIVPCPLP